MQPKSFKEELEFYIANCYPDGASDSKRDHISRAFYAGAIVVHAKQSAIVQSTVGVGEQQKQILALAAEVTEGIEEIIHTPCSCAKCTYARSRQHLN